MRWFTEMGVTMVLVVGLSASAADVTGSWHADVPGPGGSAASEALQLAVKDSNVTGTFTNAVGGVSEIKDGKWDGGQLRFWVPWNPGKLEATGKLVGATLQLDVKTSEWGGRRIFTRVAPGKASQ